MRDLFRRQPLHEFADYSRSHLHAGTAYQARFRERPGRAAMWTLEQELIGRILAQWRTVGAPGRVLDFATGTGRIAAELERGLPHAQLHGIDISRDMLATAQGRCARVAFHAMDGRQALQAFGPAAFDLVCAFRFFPNADPALRTDIAAQIAQLTRPGGRVMLNNHRNFWSTSYLALRASGNRSGNYGARNADIEQLFLRHGFVRERSYSLGIWPQTDFRCAGLSWPLALALERFNLRRCARWHRLGCNTVFVLRKPLPGPA